MRIPFKILFVFFAFSYYLSAQQEIVLTNVDTNVIVDTAISDTITLDTINVTDVIEKITTYYDFSKYRGSTLYFNDNINYTEIPTNNYFFTTDILSQFVPTNPLFLTVPGNHSAFSIFGANPKENISMLGGIAMNDIFGNANFDFISSEFANSMEIMYGSSAAIKTGKSGMAVNIQPFIYNTSNPYTKIWYTQGDNKLIGVDGIFSQNFLPNWNITGGFKRMSSNSYYQNSFIDMWNARLMLSFYQSNQSSFSLLYHFTNFYTGDFGGILPIDYNKNNTAASQVRSNFTTLTDRQYKTDLIFLHSYHSIDSNLIINSNLFFNHLENNIYYGNDTFLVELFLDSTGRNIASAYNYGYNTNLKYNLSNLFCINTGIEINSNNVLNTLLTNNFNGFGYNIYGMGVLDFNTTNISLGGRYGHKYDKNVFSFGGSITKNITKKMSLIADISYLKTDPISVFNYYQEEHFLTLLGLKYDSIISFNLFYRDITDQIIFSTILYSQQQIESNKLFGGTIKSNINLPYNLKAIITLSDYVDKFANNSSTLYANLSLEYKYAKSQSSIIFGLSGTLLQSENKYYFSPLDKNYIRTELNEGLEFDGFSAYIKAKLGNCFLQISFKNILGLTYSYLAYYPMLKQEFNLSLTWAFP